MAETPEPARRRAAAYWLALAFHMKGESRAARNALVLTAHRTCGLDILDLVRLTPHELPEKLRPFAATFERFLAEEGRVSAQAFVVDRLAEQGIEVLPITDARYPPHVVHRLRPSHAPTVLLVAGNVDLLRQPGVAVSGSRDARDQGLRFARAAGEALARSGVTLVSGLARGVDREALYGAMDAGGAAIGVAAEGILGVRATRSPEVAQGRLVVVSEFDPAQRWGPGLAMTRNTTIAGLSRALIVADCVAAGGTLDQVDTHCKHSIDVYVRRGSGEGALVAEIARRAGVTGIPWERGSVRIPGLVGASEPASDCEIRRDAGAVEVHVRMGRDASLEDVIDLVRAHWDADRSSDPAPATTPEVVRKRPAAAPPVATAAPATPEPAADPVGDALRNGAAAALSISDLVRITGLKDGRVRQRVKSLVAARDVDAVRDGKRAVYRWAAGRALQGVRSAPTLFGTEV